jgi:(p)ppGpp synthase/HD superfamily hydrolase
VIAALLHDAVEDHGGLLRQQDIEQNFGPNVARMVEGLSDSFSEDASKKLSWMERKQAYIQRLRGEPEDVRLISAADKLYNARAILEDYREIGPKVWDRFKRGRSDQIWYFDELIAVFKSFGTSGVGACSRRTQENISSRSSLKRRTEVKGKLAANCLKQRTRLIRLFRAEDVTLARVTSVPPSIFAILPSV